MGIPLGEVAEGGPDNQPELDLVVEGYSEGTDAGAGVGREDRCGGLEEEEGAGGTRGGELGDVVAGEES